MGLHNSIRSCVLYDWCCIHREFRQLPELASHWRVRVYRLPSVYLAASFNASGGTGRSGNCLQHLDAMVPSTIHTTMVRMAFNCTPGNCMDIQRSDSDSNSGSAQCKRIINAPNRKTHSNKFVAETHSLCDHRCTLRMDDGKDTSR